MSAKKKQYTVKTKFVFEGEFYITAESKKQAKEYVMKQCGLVLGREIFTTLPDEICEWCFDPHANTIVK